MLTQCMTYFIGSGFGTAFSGGATQNKQMGLLGEYINWL